MSEGVLTPMQRQYKEIKATHTDSLLFFRLGDFYEMFYEDAIIVSKELGLTLTSRHKNSPKEMKMCGVPHHSADKYIAQLTQKGHKIAICDQVSDPKLPGIVKRAVVRIVTPGTTFQDEVLDDKKNNYLLSIVEKASQFAVAYTDITTGELKVSVISDFEILKSEIFRIRPAEVVLSQALFSGTELTEFLSAEFSMSVSTHDYSGDAYNYLLNHFRVKNLEGFGIDQDQLIVEVTANLLSYLQETQKTDLHHIQTIRKFSRQDFMNLDTQTIRNLELLFTLYDGSKEGSLLGVLDKTKTSAGGRLLRKIILEPLLDKEIIERRLDAIEEIIKNYNLQIELETLKKMYDLERIVARLSCNRGTPRDLLALKDTLLYLPDISQHLQSLQAKKLQEIYKTFQDNSLKHIVDFIEQSIAEDAPMLLNEGNIIKTGHNKELDELKKIMQGGKEWLDDYIQKEKDRTGISTLKIGYNKVFGYYIEISKGQSVNAPENYIRKQTLTNAERYITPILKEYEEKVLTAKTSAIDLEYNLFMEVREELIKHIEVLQKVAHAISWLDVYATFAKIAQENNYVRPQINETRNLTIESGRHPVVESMLTGIDTFVANHSSFSQKTQYNILLTGPNMAGKSTYLRQNALIVLMAQIGCFVPAKNAEIGIVDRIFTRIGASDNLGKGQSTFMVEMQETANILHNATNKSLLILDEIGRGTSTYDGLSLAWAIFEHIHNKIQAKTLFATHYHEMIELAESQKNAANFCMAVTENSDGVVFLHKVVEGGADDSYGIEVAKLAGLPREVISRANDVLTKLENENSGNVNEFVKENLEPLKKVPRERKKVHDNQLSFVVPEVVEKVVMQEGDSEIVKALQDMDLNKITPVEALLKLSEWKMKHM